MNAVEARAKTAQAKREIANTAEQNEARKKREDKAAVAKALKTELPFVVKQLEKEIKRWASVGKTEADYSFSVNPAGSALCQATQKHFEEKGYKVSSRYASGTDEMGDFNAPCNVFWENYKLTVSW